MLAFQDKLSSALVENQELHQQVSQPALNHFDIECILEALSRLGEKGLIDVDLLRMCSRATSLKSLL